jgi:hypothetical protein
MANENFLVTQDFKSPFMTITGQAHRPHKIEYKPFRAGSVISGKMHYRGGKPAFVMIDETLVVPLGVIKKVHAEDISVNRVNSSSSFDAGQKSYIVPNEKYRYTDAGIIGAVIGIAFVYVGQKKGLKIYDEAMPKNKYVAMGVGALIGSALGMYIAKRFSGDDKIVKNDTPIK